MRRTGLKTSYQAKTYSVWGNVSNDLSLCTDCRLFIYPGTVCPKLELQSLNKIPDLMPTEAHVKR